MNLPSFEYLTMRSLVFGTGKSPWPSAMKMSPFGATRTSDGLLNSSGPLPATSGLPSVISRWPSGANCVTVWFLPSVTQTVPSGAANSPCGHLNKPEPKLTSKRPAASNF